MPTAPPMLTPELHQEASSIAARDAWNRIVEAFASGMADGEAGNPFAEGAAAAIPGIRNVRQRDANRFDAIVPSYRDGERVDFGNRAPIGGYDSRLSSLAADIAEFDTRAKALAPTIVETDQASAARWRGAGEGEWSSALEQMRGVMVGMPLVDQMRFMRALPSGAGRPAAPPDEGWKQFMAFGEKWGMQ